jgi:hypothetical protein
MIDVAAAPLRAGQSVWVSLVVHGQNGECLLSGIKFPDAANILELSLLSPDQDRRPVAGRKPAVRRGSIAAFACRSCALKC